MSGTARIIHGNARIIHGNALDLPLPDESVDLVVTSPPYFGLRSYQDSGQHYDGQIGAEPTPAEFVDALIAATREMARVLKPSGSIWVNLGDSYAGSGKGGNTSAANSTAYLNERAKGYHPCPTTDQAPRTATTSSATTSIRDSVTPALTPIPGNKSLHGIPWRYALRCVDDLHLILRGDTQWVKASGLPDNARDRVRRRHEYWFHFVKSGRYYHDAAYVGTLPASAWLVNPARLVVPPEVAVRHMASFPLEFPRRFIFGWCPEGGTVLDPFGGSGTTALVAKALGRTGITVDLSHDYCRLATWRTNDRDQLAAAMQVEKPTDKPLEGQLGLFGDDAA